MLYETPYSAAMEHIALIDEDNDADRRFDAAIHGIDFKASGSSNATGTLKNSHNRMADRYRAKAR